ncbi:PREDICTED: uncharacterized protein LOC106305189 isoform X3 [Brassica oleracea var. oleracea]|uniref:uncharacterized protein LOC106305189 isoform X3 n=1 Tax=Brassica oleracea var. oleracea TaxID=109376 RepID=UPI0006A6ED83|nr:PREDICTED: uncharacterized protein LOC106305189 isoform X3 [Brassica oleracea var. oleracea]
METSNQLGVCLLSYEMNRGYFADMKEFKEHGGKVKRELRGIEEQRKMMRREAGEVRRRRNINLTSTTDQVHESESEEDVLDEGGDDEDDLEEEHETQVRPEAEPEVK